MSRRKANPNLPMYMVERNGSYETRRPIDDSFRAHFMELTGKKAVKIMAIGKVGSSKRPTSADLARHGKNLDEIEARMKPAKVPSAAAATAPSTTKLYKPAEILQALDAWFTGQRETRLVSYCNGILPSIRPASDEHAAKSAYLGSLVSALNRFRNFELKPDEISIEGHSSVPTAILAALEGESIAVHDQHPMLRNRQTVLHYLELLVTLERMSIKFALGDYEFEEDADESGRAGQSALNSTLGQSKAIKLSELFESYVESEPRKNLAKKRAFWELLITNIGDVKIGDVKTATLNEFKIKLRSAPKTRAIEFAEFTLDQIIQRSEDIKDRTGTLLRRAPKTIFDHFCCYKAVFEHAKKLKHIDENPVDGAMPPKPSPESGAREIEAYTADDIAAIFSSPLFAGCSKVRSAPKSGAPMGNLYGYRKHRGTFIERDGRYFMPYLACLTGARMEEWGGARSGDIKKHLGVWYLDLTQRNVKTPASKRLVPLHPWLVNSDQIDFISYVLDRQRSKDEFLFPEFTPSADDGIASEAEAHSILKEGSFDPDDVLHESDPEILKRTATYSRWFGKWRKANGFVNPNQNFHSFRHTFKDAIRYTDVKEEIHDLITGHHNPALVGREYGKAMATRLLKLPKLYEAICQVDFPTLPLFRADGSRIKR